MINVTLSNHYRPGMQVDPIVRAFIISETFFWSGFNFFNPILAIYISTKVSGGSIEAAGTAITVYMIARIFSELVVGRVLSKSTDRVKFIYSVVGIMLTALFYFSFIFADNVLLVYIVQFMLGVSFGIVSPAKFSLFSEHLDKGKESTEWSIYDAAVYGGMAFTSMLGGFIAQEYGFNVLIMLASIIILVGAIPFMLFVNSVSVKK